MTERMEGESVYVNGAIRKAQAVSHDSGPVYYRFELCEEQMSVPQDTWQERAVYQACRSSIHS